MSKSEALVEAPSWYLAGEIDETGATHRVAVNASPFQVGRRPGLRLPLPCLTVSKLHAELVLDGRRLWVRDLNSTNGTFVNGQRIHGRARVREGDLVQFGNVIFQVCRSDEQRTDTSTVSSDSSDRALTLLQFDRLISERAVTAYFQPIVDLATGKAMGHEVLGRSWLYGLSTPHEMFEIAGKLKCECELSRILRIEGIQASRDLPDARHLFLNTHPAELAQPGLVESLVESRDSARDLRLTLEIHESTITDPVQMETLREQLTGLGVSLAYDDFGSGQSRLLELTESPPEFLKFDMQFVQGLATAPPQRQNLVANLVRMTVEAGIVAVAEGIETADDSETCRQMGFQLGQGFHLGRPSPARPDLLDAGIDDTVRTDSATKTMPLR